MVSVAITRRIGFCHRIQVRIGKTPKIVPVTSVKRKPSGSRPGWRLATSEARDLAAATASSSLAKTQASFSTGMPPLSQSTANNAVSFRERAPLANLSKMTNLSGSKNKHWAFYRGRELGNESPTGERFEKLKGAERHEAVEGGLAPRSAFVAAITSAASDANASGATKPAGSLASLRQPLRSRRRSPVSPKQRKRRTARPQPP
jgi:hypothetical protein